MNNQCSKGKCAVNTALIFIFMLAYEGIFHHTRWMMKLYQSTPQLWRPMTDMQALMPLMFIRDIALAFIIVCLYKKFVAGRAAMAAACATPPDAGAQKKCCPHIKSLCFGVKIGTLLGVMQATFYVYLPISPKLAIGWLLASVVEGALIGLLLALVNRNKECAPL